MCNFFLQALYSACVQNSAKFVPNCIPLSALFTLAKCSAAAHLTGWPVICLQKLLVKQHSSSLLSQIALAMIRPTNLKQLRCSLLQYESWLIVQVTRSCGVVMNKAQLGLNISLDMMRYHSLSRPPASCPSSPAGKQAQTYLVKYT